MRGIRQLTAEYRTTPFQCTLVDAIQGVTYDIRSVGKLSVLLSIHLGEDTQWEGVPTTFVFSRGNVLSVRYSTKNRQLYLGMLVQTKRADSVFDNTAP